ncbi:hypothetical protein [Nostoc sp. C110]|uniref:hypothetical protein n=1 Tax=Nostoc sp. C110 TaxID=3349876 RepID=UPI00370D9ED2
MLSSPEQGAASQFLKKYPTLEKISGNWKWRLDKQNPPMQTYAESDLLGFACGSVTYRLKGKIIKAGCSR